MAIVKVFADKQTDGQTNGQAKNYMPLIYQWGEGHKKEKMLVSSFSNDAFLPLAYKSHNLICLLFVVCDSFQYG